MALRFALRQSPLNSPLRYKAWLKMVQTKVKSADDASSVGALSAVCDYYGQAADPEDIKAKHNYEIKWEDWSHLVTPGLVDKLKAKLETIGQEQYETETLAHSAMEETEDLKHWRHIVTWNAVLHLNYLAEQDSIIENISHARPIHTLNHWELTSMYKYDDCPTRWDNELGWFMPNNDQVSEDVVNFNYFQFQKDYGKVALQRYYYDWMGKHQILSTVGKISQTERED
jgi:hypothetical protein